MKQKINFLVPVYYDVPSFNILRKNIIKNIGTEFFTINFYLIDDTSGSDNEMQEILELNDCQIITPPFNLGHQRALVFGIRKICQQLEDNEIIVTLDSDGEDRPEDLTRILAKLNEVGGFVLAKRTKRQESPLFKFLYINFKFLFFALTGTIIKSGNYMAYRVSSIRKVIHHPYFNLCYSSVFLGLRSGNSFDVRIFSPKPKKAKENFEPIAR